MRESALDDGVGMSTATDPAPIEGTANTRDDSLIVAGVVVLGLLVAIPALLSLLGAVALSVDGRGGMIAGLFSVAYTALGFGLILRIETARGIYVVLAVIGLIIQGIATLAGVGSVAGILLMLIPVIFLTRPGVKRVFR
jgi:hypothetical protein